MSKATLVVSNLPGYCIAFCQAAAHSPNVSLLDIVSVCIAKQPIPKGGIVISSMEFILPFVHLVAAYLLPVSSDIV